MKWKITRNYIDGRGWRDDEPSIDLVHRFRLLDDDGNLYYEGTSDDSASQLAFAPLDWAMGVGCTEIQYLQDSGEWMTLWRR